MDRIFFAIGCLFAGLSVALGAFGSHALKQQLPFELLNVFEVAVRYQMYHGLALLSVAWAISRWPSRGLVVCGWLFVAGSIVFPGSLYALSLTGIKWFGAITPLGGLAWILAWFGMAWVLLSSYRP